MEPYPSNSYKSKEEPPPTDEVKPRLRVVPEGTRVIRRRPPMGRRFKETFFTEEGGFMRNLEHLIGDVIVPTIGELQGIISAVSMVNRMLHGDRAFPQNRNPSRPNIVSTNVRPATNYSRYSKETPSRVGRNYERYHHDDIILPTINDVREVIKNLREDIEEYEFVSVRDLYEMVGVGFNHTDEQWGWYDLSGAYPKRVSGGYQLIVPPVQPRG